MAGRSLAVVNSLLLVAVAWAATPRGTSQVKNAALAAISEGDWVLEECTLLIHKGTFERAGFHVYGAFCSTDKTKDFELFKLTWHTAVTKLKLKGQWPMEANPWRSGQVGPVTHYGRDYLFEEGGVGIGVRYYNGSIHWYLFSQTLPSLTAETVRSHLEKVTPSKFFTSGLHECTAARATAALGQAGYVPKLAVCAEAASGGTLDGQVVIWNIQTTLLYPMWPFDDEKPVFVDKDGAKITIYEQQDSALVVLIRESENGYTFEFAFGSKDEE